VDEGDGDFFGDGVVDPLAPPVAPALHGAEHAAWRRVEGQGSGIGHAARMVARAGKGNSRAQRRSWGARRAADGKRKTPDRSGVSVWWRWWELNPRPKALHPRHYMLSPPLDLVPRQHGVRSAPGNQPVSSTVADRRPPRLDSRNDDPTSTSTGTSGFGAYALSGESVVVVVGN